MPVSPFFVPYITRNLTYCHTLLDANTKDTSAALRFERDNISRAIHFGIQLAETAELSARLLLRIFPFVERWKIAPAWLPLFEKAYAQLAGDETDLQLQIQNRLGQIQRLSYQTDKAILTHQAILSVLELRPVSPIFKARVCFNLCENYRTTYRFSEAQHYAGLGLELLDQEDAQSMILEASLRNSVGLIYIDQGNFQDAIRMVEPALKLWEMIGDQLTDWGRTLHTFAIAHHRQGDGEKADVYYHKALQKLDETDSHTEKLRVYVGLGWLRMQQDRYQVACQLLEEAVRKAEEVSADTETKGLLQTNLANGYLHLHQYPQAKNAFNLSIMYWKRIGNEMLVGNSIGGLGEVLEAEGNLREAWQKYEKAIALLSKFPKNKSAMSWMDMYAKKQSKL